MFHTFLKRVLNNGKDQTFIRAYRHQNDVYIILYWLCGNSNKGLCTETMYLRKKGYQCPVRMNTANKKHKNTHVETYKLVHNNMQFIEYYFLWSRVSKDSGRLSFSFGVRSLRVYILVVINLVVCLKLHFRNVFVIIIITYNLLNNASLNTHRSSIFIVHKTRCV